MRKSVASRKSGLTGMVWYNYWSWVIGYGVRKIDGLEGCEAWELHSSWVDMQLRI